MKPRELAAPDLLLAEDHHDHVVVFHLLLLGGAGWGSVAGEWLLGALMQIPPVQARRVAQGECYGRGPRLSRSESRDALRRSGDDFGTATQSCSRHHDQPLRPLSQCQAAGIGDDAPDVVGIVRGFRQGVPTRQFGEELRPPSPSLRQTRFRARARPASK